MSDEKLIAVLREWWWDTPIENLQAVTDEEHAMDDLRSLLRYLDEHGYRITSIDGSMS